jgi:hypothetical protein
MADYWIVTGKRFHEHPTLEAAEHERARIMATDPDGRYRVIRCKRFLKSASHYKQLVQLLTDIACDGLTPLNAARITELLSVASDRQPAAGNRPKPAATAIAPMRAFSKMQLIEDCIAVHVPPSSGRSRHDRRRAENCCGRWCGLTPTRASAMMSSHIAQWAASSRCNLETRRFIRATPASVAGPMYPRRPRTAHGFRRASRVSPPPTISGFNGWIERKSFYRLANSILGIPPGCWA